MCLTSTGTGGKSAGSKPLSLPGAMTSQLLISLDNHPLMFFRSTKRIFSYVVFMLMPFPVDIGADKATGEAHFRYSRLMVITLLGNAAVSANMSSPLISESSHVETQNQTK